MPCVYAIDCNLLSNKELCLEIQNSNISEEEKNYLISDIIDDLKNFPDHDLVREWNLKVNTTLSNTEKHDEGYIKNAYVKILSVMPSVLENNTLYIDNNGEVLTSFNHEVEIPSGNYGGDCKTEYNLVENNGLLKIYMNENYVNSGDLVSFTANQNSDLKARYEITVQTNIKHYHTESYCCKWNNNGNCIQYCNRCSYSHTEEKTDNLNIDDNLNLKLDNSEAQASFNVVDKYLDTVKGTLKGDNYTSMQLLFRDSYLKEFDYTYSLVYNESLNNILTVKADRIKQIEHKNLIYEKDNDYNVILKNTDDCKILVYTHFTNKTFDCNLNFQQFNISIETDKLSYKNNETINVNIKPADKYFNVSYANNTINAKNNLSLNAIYPFNRISILYNGRIYEKIINVKNNDSVLILFSLSMFFGFNYVFTEIVKKYFKEF